MICGGQSANHPPVFYSDPMDLSVDEDVALSQTLPAVDPDGGSLSYGKLLGPDWVNRKFRWNAVRNSNERGTWATITALCVQRMRPEPLMMPCCVFM